MIARNGEARCKPGNGFLELSRKINVTWEAAMFFRATHACGVTSPAAQPEDQCNLEGGDVLPGNHASGVTSPAAQPGEQCNLEGGKVSSARPGGTCFAAAPDRRAMSETAKGIEMAKAGHLARNRINPGWPAVCIRGFQSWLPAMEPSLPPGIQPGFLVLVTSGQQ